MARQVIENYWCDHCGIVASKHCELIFPLTDSTWAELHFCPECLRKVFITQLDKLPSGERSKFISYYRGKGLPK